MKRLAPKTEDELFKGISFPLGGLIVVNERTKPFLKEELGERFWAVIVPGCYTRLYRAWRGDKGAQDEVYTTRFGLRLHVSYEESR